MPRYKLTIEYNGQAYNGWQRQPGLPTVQQSLEEAIAPLLRKDEGPIEVYGSGRTDAGVHAIAQVAHVDLQRAISPDKLRGAINFYLDEAPITIIDAERVSDDFHARFSARQRHYMYRIINRRAPLAIDIGLAWHVIRPLDVKSMHDVGQYLVGTHDFTTFRHSKCQSKSPIKTVDYLRVEQFGPQEVRLYVGARSFLHHQIRSFAGCLCKVGLGDWSGQDLQNALAARDRTALALNAPSDGLYFMAVDY